MLRRVTQDWELPHCYGAFRIFAVGLLRSLFCRCRRGCFPLFPVCSSSACRICMKDLLRCANANPIRVCQKRVAVAPVSTVGFLVEQTSQDAKHKARGGSNLGGHSRQGQSEKNLLGKEGVQGSREHANVEAAKTPVVPTRAPVCRVLVRRSRISCLPVFASLRSGVDD